MYLLAGLGLIYSFWTYGLTTEIFNINTRLAIIGAIVHTYTIAYFTTAAGLLWGLHILELNYVKLWGLIKFVEGIFNIANLISCFVTLHMGYYIPVVIINLALGVYVKISVWNLYKNVSKSDTNNTGKTNIDLTLPSYEASTMIPCVHKTTMIN